MNAPPTWRALAWLLVQFIAAWVRFRFWCLVRRVPVSEVRRMKRLQDLVGPG